MIVSRALTGSGEVVVAELTKQYKRLRAVDGLSFVVRPGRVTGFLGPNGAGKTTTLRMMVAGTPTSTSRSGTSARCSRRPAPTAAGPGSTTSG